jgi:hypothetical protein
MPFPNKIKYSTAITAGTIKTGNFLIGVNSGATYGPTSVTGFYQSLTPVLSGFTVHQNKATLGPSTFRPNNNSEFITLTKALGGNVTGVTDSLVYLKSQSDIVVINRDYEDIVTSGLTLCLDAGYTPSYSRLGTTWTDLSFSGNNGTLTNGPTFNSSNGGSIVFDGVNDYISCGNSVSVQIYQGTISAWVKTSSPGGSYRGIITKQGNYGLFVRDGVLATYDWGNSQDITTGINIADNTWKNVSMTFTTNTGSPSNNAIIYLNGSAVLTTTIKYGVNNVELQLGNGGDVAQYISGSIAIGSLYNRALTSSEVLQNYNAQKSRFGL